MGDDFEAALYALLDETRSPDPVLRARAGGEIGKLLEANNLPVGESGEPRYYSQDVRPALRARPLTDEEEARILGVCREAFLTTDPVKAENRAWFLNAMRASRPQLAAPALLRLLISNSEGLDEGDMFVAIMALVQHLMMWQETPGHDALVRALQETDPRPFLERYIGSHDQRGEAAGAAGMALERVKSILVGRRGTPAGARFRVQLGPDQGPRDVVSVWARDGEEATQRAIDWIAAMDLGGPDLGSQRVERISEDPRPSDLGIARRNDEVDHVHFDHEGRRRSTLFRVEINDVAEMTRSFRHDEACASVREELRAVGVDAGRSAVMAMTPDEKGGPPWLVILLAREGTVWTWRGPQIDVAQFGMPPGWSREDPTTLEEHWRRWMRAARRYLDAEGTPGV
jgi:hypothetical protein